MHINLKTTGVDIVMRPEAFCTESLPIELELVLIVGPVDAGVAVK